MAWRSIRLDKKLALRVAEFPSSWKVERKKPRLNGSDFSFL